MPQSNEPGTTGNDEENNAPGDKLPPRRRRRAASRPAGPPMAEAPGTATPAIPATDAEVSEGDAVTGTGSAPQAEAAAPARPRRRAVRKATAPAGAPKA
ncbi:hypothetical protein ACFYZN_03990, partial [Streptomyces sp. NPDC001777]|uniref:hypothetical protein n=1 Tax=Streptomyces sp. NPDC001777 TaxID=3364608 RepID=UPI0036CAC36B